ncbi:hypothetical protein ACFYXH_20910 [Streptomyces sp. NPDC002730]|uniref:LppU/SCO3897 family protein n=1 Tax=unclassified Streptomyces TaxID=2593676 RepID=UPI0036C386B6
MSATPPLHEPIALVTDAPRKRNRLVLLGLVVVLAGLVAFSVFGPHDSKDDAGTLKAGDCFQNTGTTETPEVKKLGCTDAHADYTVLKTVKDAVSGTLACSDVTGATGSLTQVGAESFVVCFKESK